MIEQTVGDFRRRIEFHPGHHWPGGPGRRDYGNGSVRMRFVLIGPKGAVQWLIGTEWMPEAARADVKRRRIIHGIAPSEDQGQKPRGWDLGYHSPKPMYEDQASMGECEYIGCECYYDGSGLNADYLIEGFLNSGDDWVWNRLEAYYYCVFDDKPFPNFDPIIEPHPDNRPKVA